MSIEKSLTGGHPNSLGNTLEVVEDVLNQPAKFEELFNCYFSEDEVVRLRVSSAIKRICKVRKELVIPYIDRLLNEITLINQASTQWTLATLFLLLEDDLSETQNNQAIIHLKKNIEEHTDWIVLNFTMETLFEWSKENVELREWLRPHLERIKKDKRKSVSKRAAKYLGEIS